MASVPKSVQIDLDSKPVKAAIESAREAGYEVGHSEGLAKGRQEILDFLQHAYIEDEGRPDRGTPEAKAILELAKSCQLHIIELQKGKK